MRLERDATGQLSAFRRGANATSFDYAEGCNGRKRALPWLRFRRGANATSFDYAEGRLVQWSQNGIVAGQLVRALPWLRAADTRHRPVN
jgi:hypothetical protein